MFTQISMNNKTELVARSIQHATFGVTYYLRKVVTYALLHILMFISNYYYLLS